MRKALPRLVFGLALVLLLGAASAPAVQAGPDAARASASREYIVKAAFLYNFAKFTEWPAEAFADAGAPLRICVLGEDPFHGALAALEGRTVKNRVIVTSRPSSTGSLERCHLLFIGASQEGRLATILKILRGMPVLAVGEAPHFATSGGTIRLETVDNRIRFEINVRAAQHAGLRLDSRLLKLGRIVGSRAAFLPHRPVTAEEAAWLATIAPSGGN